MAVTFAVESLESDVTTKATHFDPEFTYFADGTRVVMRWQGGERRGVTFGMGVGSGPYAFQAVRWDDGGDDGVAPHVLHRDEVPAAAFRETTLRVTGVERVVRTELGGKIRTVKALEAAHTKAVKAAIIELRIAASPDSMPHEMAERLAKRATQFPKNSWDAARRPLRPVTTEDPTTYLVEVEPGHYATEDAADMLVTAPQESTEEPEEVPPATVDGASFLSTLLSSVAA